MIAAVVMTALSVVALIASFVLLLGYWKTKPIRFLAIISVIIWLRILFAFLNANWGGQ